VKTLLRRTWPERYSRTEALLDITFLLACCHCHYSWSETPGTVMIAVHFGEVPGAAAELRTFAQAVKDGDVDGARLGVYQAVRTWLWASPRWIERQKELESIGFPQAPSQPM